MGHRCSVLATHHVRSIRPDRLVHRRVFDTSSACNASAPVQIWIDIENPPQVQYLLPLRRAFQAMGAQTIITARDYGSTVEMLRVAGTNPHVFGTRVGRRKVVKVAATWTRARDLRHFFTHNERPDALVAASRAAPLVAWRLNIPSFVIHDYEYTHRRLYRYTRSMVLYPDAIDRSVAERGGLRPNQVASFRGMKEDLTFAGINVDAVEPYDLGPISETAVRVLFRPPSETSHYYRKASSQLARAALERLAKTDAVVVFSPRDASQIHLLQGLTFRHRPVVLSRPVPFVSLLKSADMVVCSGGTMLREAAYLGIPAYSIFGSEIGAVDRWLERLERVQLLTEMQDLDRIVVKRRGPLNRLDSNPELPSQIVTLVASRAISDRATRIPERGARR
jgi:uncharacterized protein